MAAVATPFASTTDGAALIVDVVALAGTIFVRVPTCIDAMAKLPTVHTGMTVLELADALTGYDEFGVAGGVQDSEQDAVLFAPAIAEFPNENVTLHDAALHVPPFGSGLISTVTFGQPSVDLFPAPW